MRRVPCGSDVMARADVYRLVGLWRCLILATALAAIALAGHAQGSEAPPPGQFAPDPRIRHIVHRSDAIVELRVGPYPTLIELAPLEAIQEVACNGNEANPRAWDIVWRTGQNYLFIEAHAGAQAAGLTIKTARESYVFDLVADPRASLFDPARTAKLVVELAGDPSPSPTRGRQGAMFPADRDKPSIGQSSSPFRRNERYSLEVVHEAEDIRPREVFDDGLFTYMRFPNNLAIPAIYRSTPGSRNERLINSHMEGDYVVLEGLAPLWNLRLGGSLLGVFNERYDAEGIPPEDGTTMPSISRQGLGGPL